jgi:hypothetical protein
MRWVSGVVLGCAAVLACTGLAAAEMPFVEWRDLSDRDITPQGRLVLSLGDKPWKHTETEHFVYHFRDLKEAETVFLHAEVYYGWVKEFFGVEKDGWSKKAHVFIFEDKDLWKEFKAKARAGTSAEAFTNGWELYIYRNPFWLAPQKTLAHELTHVIVFRFLKGPIPLFLNEGVAEYISTRAVATRFEGDEYSVRLLGPIAEKDYIPLNQLIRLEVYPEAGLELYYKESEHLVRYLVQLGGRGSFYEMLFEVSKGTPFNQAILTFYKTSLENLETQFRRFSTQ